MNCEFFGVRVGGLMVGFGIVVWDGGISLVELWWLSVLQWIFVHV